MDFFVHGVATWRSHDADRLDGDEYPPWSVHDAVEYLRERCGLRDRLPGFAVEQHGEAFFRWRDAIDSGVLKPPFQVTHLDAHADLGLGDNGYIYLTTELLFEEAEDRVRPRVGDDALTDGNYLAFAVACRWISSVTYVFARGGGNDVLFYFKKGFDRHAEYIQLPAVGNRAELTENLLDPDRWPIAHLEPEVPLTELRWDSFDATAPFDLITLARSPAYTPAEADPIYDEIRARFIAEVGI